MWWEAEHPPNPKKSDVTYRTWNASRPCIALLGWETGEGSETIRVMNNHVFSKNIQFRVCNLYKNLDFAVISFQSKDISIQRQLELENKYFQKICYQKLLKDCNKFKYFYVLQRVQRCTAWLLTIETCWANEGHLDFFKFKTLFSAKWEGNTLKPQSTFPGFDNRKGPLAAPHYWLTHTTSQGTVDSTARNE